MSFDVELARRFFPPLESGVAYFENAGRSFVARPALERLQRFVGMHPVQPAWPHRLSTAAKEMLDAGIETAANLMGASSDEVILGPSTTLNVFVLAAALRAEMTSGDVVVVSEQDHEANSGAWRRLAEAGVEIREWKVDPERGNLRVEDLDALLDERVKLVCFPHVSNVVGTINDVAAIAKRAHAVGARVCVDGVAYAPHRQVDVRAWDVDFYYFSLYKVFGPHLGLMYIRRDHLECLPNQSHYFHAGDLRKKLNPGGLQYELAASIAGIGDYLGGLAGGTGTFRDRTASLWTEIAAYEEELVAPLLSFLTQANVRVVGEPSANRLARVPTVSFVPRKAPAEVLAAMPTDIAIGAGHFYAARCVKGLGLNPDEGVLRVSMVHYNTAHEVQRLTNALLRAL
ncbi:MAG: aminotransferase class V-fold PLP-dependent enzyme [Myxococcota bacterium]